MKIRLIVIVILVLVGLSVWFFTPNMNSRRHESQKETNLQTEDKASMSRAVNAANRGQIPRAPVSPTTNIPYTPPIGQTNSTKRKDWEKKMNELIHQGLQQTQWEWKMPIEFYGKVVDEQMLPVTEANIHFVWNDLSDKGTSDADTISSPDGRFSLMGVKGKAMSVYVSKTGYYTSKQKNSMSFEYARDYESNYYRPDANNPVIFHLRKKGLGVDLVTSQYGVAPDYIVSAPKDGTPIRVDLMQRKAGASGQLEIQQWIETDATSYRNKFWKLRLAISDGGFIEHQDEFPFLAPETGYISELVFPSPTAEPGPSLGVSRKKYYIAFGNPKVYGRLEMSASSSTGRVILEYAINPDGSRYLEGH